MGLFDKKKKTYTVEGSVRAPGGKTTTVYRKDGSKKSESHVNFHGFKDTPVSGFTGANSRFMQKTEDTIKEKVPATGYMVNYNRKGEVKSNKSLDNSSKTGINPDLYRSQVEKTYRNKKNSIKVETKVDPSMPMNGSVTAMYNKGAMAYNKGPHAQTSAERYAENAESDMKTGKGTKADIAYDIKKASEKGYKKGTTAMKEQGYNDRLDDSLGSKNGKKSQSMKDRRDESEGMEKSKDKGKFSGNKSSSPTAYMDGPMAYSSADKVHRNRRGVTAYMKGAAAMKYDSTTDKGIKGLGSSNKSGGKYV